ncbi:phytolongin Phyl2.2-like [Actinidia eriantha]|uniref:phytolongin Phyl2.2-like n=1 Tax=Actinidia eriantha TaxID=165200 RepID=UPI00258E3E97|nr:phytolongin Phyl2.2-like [Actinidia eriantha]
MTSNLNLIFYACISKGSTILAEFNSRDANHGTLAAKCLEKTPPLHTTFSHTVRKRTYTFFVDDPFAYFAISDENLKNADVLSFLRSVKAAFDGIVISEGVKWNENLNSHCLQGEFSPVFHQLLASPVQFDGPNSPREATKDDRTGSLDSPRGKRMGSVPLLGLGGDISNSLKTKSKKRYSVEVNGDGKERMMGENKVDVSDAIVLSREFSIAMEKNGLFGGDSPHQRAKRAWKRHVWVVLSLDLIVCSILFGVWLWICRGFKCIDG